MTTRRLALLGALLVAPSGAHAEDWVELGFDASRTRATTEKTGVTFSPAWTYTLKEGPIVASPVSVGGLLVVGGGAGTLVALDPAGEAIWSRGLDGAIGATPAARGGRLVVATLAGKAFSLRLQDGAIEWQRVFGGQNYGSPTIVSGAGPGQGDTVVLPEGFPGVAVQRLELASGETRWTTAPGAVAEIVYSSPTVVGRQALFGMNRGRLQSVDLDTGATLWTADVGGEVFLSSPLVDGERAYFFPGDARAQLFAVDVATGRPVAGFPLSVPDPAPVAGDVMLGHGPAIGSPMKAGGLVVVQLRRDHMIDGAAGRAAIRMREYLVGIDPAGPRVVWQHLLATAIAADINGVPDLSLCATPAGFTTQDGAVVIATSSSIAPRLAVFDVLTGEERWSAPLSAPGRSSPTFANGRLYVATDAGVVHAFTSTANLPPAAPTSFVPGADESVATNEGTLRWMEAADPEGEPLSYVMRLNEAGRADAALELACPTAAAVVSSTLVAGTAYEFQVRSRDPWGALSPWSRPQRFRAAAPSPVPASMTPAPVPTPMEPDASVPPAPVDASAQPMAPAGEPSPPSLSMRKRMPAAGEPAAGCSLAGGPSGRGAASGLMLLLAVGTCLRRAPGRRRG